MKTRLHVIPEGDVRLAVQGMSAAGVTLLVLFGFSLGGSALQIDNRIYSRDNSDWWSVTKALDSDETISTQERELAASNFRILGVHLNEDMFTQAARAIAQGKTIERGDAATGRAQACYVSNQDAKVHLIFEQGEVTFTFYLFSDDRPWVGDDLCVRSSVIPPNVSTASGLHLGQTPPQVMVILGSPSRRSNGELFYSVHAKKKASPQDLKRLREANPQLSDEDFHKAYDFYDLNASVRAKFADSKLKYLAISKAETN